jgi:predicted enzyme related to lactoylglutathione lyase
MSKKTSPRVKSKRPPAKKSARKAGKAASKKPPLSIASLHADYLTYKSAQLQKFYGEILELPTEHRDMDGLDYLVVRTSSSSSLGFLPPHPAMGGGDAAPREPGLYFMVPDVDKAYHHLVAKGVRFPRPPQTMPWGHRVLTTTDPEGRTIMLASEVEGED